MEQAESKWSIRKEALESVLPLASKPKLAQGDYNELVKTLVKVSCCPALQGVTGQCHWRGSTYVMAVDEVPRLGQMLQHCDLIGRLYLRM